MWCCPLTLLKDNTTKIDCKLNLYWHCFCFYSSGIKFKLKSFLLVNNKNNHNLPFCFCQIEHKTCGVFFFFFLVSLNKSLKYTTKVVKLKMYLIDGFSCCLKRPNHQNKIKLGWKTCFIISKSVEMCYEKSLFKYI